MAVKTSTLQYIPYEAEEQKAFVAWAYAAARKYPELSLLYHAANGEKRSKLTAARLRDMGVRPGIPDLCLPVARRGYHSLYIELKRTVGGRLEPAQKTVISRLEAEGNMVAVCKGAAAAKQVIEWYLGEEGQ